MKIANINNLSLVAVAMARLVNRQDGLPGLGVLYGQNHGNGGDCQQNASLLCAAAQRMEQENAAGKAVF